ncbi:FMRFamide receptor [Elysia marginata]|uniref:FMRFamide receptor n=1 Tax=Elysia marginata TaxID=1093978 RepID=A0AAV4IZB5_9GAST|nr:FMRFamide receptor [Elysia marginata]
MELCETLCAQHCISPIFEHPCYPVTQVKQCLHDTCGVHTSFNTTEEFRTQVQNTCLSGGAWNWSVTTPPDLDLVDCTGRAKRFDLQPEPRYTIPINGYLSPVIIVFSVFNNFLVCLVLLKPHMRSPITNILIAMAFSDMMTGLFPLPFFVYFFTMERVHEWVPYNWCRVTNFFMEYIPTIFHTASIWLTMVLAVQRYICVCHVFKARTLCTVQNSRRAVVIIYIAAALSQITRFFDQYPVETFQVSLLDPTTIVSACRMEYRPWFLSNIDLYFNIYFWFRVIFIHFIPCVSLVVMTVLLIYAMRVAQTQRKKLLSQNKDCESRQFRESNRLTLMLVAVVGVFLLVELPLGLIMVLLIIDRTFKKVIISSGMFSNLSLFSNFFILLSYPLNFFIYCGMSKQFRNTFKRIFKRTYSVDSGTPTTPV